jgi:nucleoid DNA-binding protein
VSLTGSALRTGEPVDVPAATVQAFRAGTGFRSTFPQSNGSVG